MHYYNNYPNESDLFVLVHSFLRTSLVMTTQEMNLIIKPQGQNHKDKNWSGAIHIWTWIQGL